ncbi:MAG: hypothetical protein AAFX93_02100 [Verrucomicrobiota bacterium]
MKSPKFVIWTFVLTIFALSSSLRGQVVAGEQLQPELGVYVDIDEEKWGAAKLNLRITNNNFQAFFFDADDLLVEPPLESIIVHYQNFVKKSNARQTIVLSKDGMMLTNKRVIKPPHRYQVRIFLRKNVVPIEYYKKPYEEKEFIGMHIINQLGGSELYDKTHSDPQSVPVAIEEVEGEAQKTGGDNAAEPEATDKEAAGEKSSASEAT